jgi:hypothetical protein
MGELLFRFRRRILRAAAAHMPISILARLLLFRSLAGLWRPVCACVNVNVNVKMLMGCDDAQCWLGSQPAAPH